MNIKEIILNEQGKPPPGRMFDLPPIEGGPMGGGGGITRSGPSPFSNLGAPTRGGSVQAVPGSTSGLVMPTGKLGTVPRTTAPTTAPSPKASASTTAQAPKASAPATATTPSTASVVGKKIGQWTKDAAVGTAKSLAKTAAVGTGLYYGAGPAYKYLTKPPESYGEEGFQKEIEKQAEIERDRKAMNKPDTSMSTQPTVDIISPEQQPSDDDGPLSTPGTFKTNEDSKELNRIKHLMKYRN